MAVDLTKFAEVLRDKGVTAAVLERELEERFSQVDEEMLEALIFAAEKFQIRGNALFSLLSVMASPEGKYFPGGLAEDEQYRGGHLEQTTKQDKPKAANVRALAEYGDKLALGKTIADGDYQGGQFKEKLVELSRSEEASPDSIKAFALNRRAFFQRDSVDEDYLKLMVVLCKGSAIQIETLAKDFNIELFEVLYPNMSAFVYLYATAYLSAVKDFVKGTNDETIGAAVANYKLLNLHVDKTHDQEPLEKLLADIRYAIALANNFEPLVERQKDGKAAAPEPVALPEASAEVEGELARIERNLTVHAG